MCRVTVARHVVFCVAFCVVLCCVVLLRQETHRIDEAVGAEC